MAFFIFFVSDRFLFYRFSRGARAHFTDTRALQSRLTPLQRFFIFGEITKQNTHKYVPALDVELLMNTFGFNEWKKELHEKKLNVKYLNWLICKTITNLWHCNTIFIANTGHIIKRLVVKLYVRIEI